MTTLTRSRSGARQLRAEKGSVPFNIVNYLVFALIAFICGYPFYYLIANSISSNEMSALGQIRWLPQGMHLSNYAQVFDLQGLPRAAVISVSRTVIGTALTVLASAYLGFMFTQDRLWKRQFWYRAVIITM